MHSDARGMSLVSLHRRAAPLPPRIEAPWMKGHYAMHNTQAPHPHPQRPPSRPHVCILPNVHVTAAFGPGPGRPTSITSPRDPHDLHEVMVQEEQGGPE